MRSTARGFSSPPVPSRCCRPAGELSHYASAFEVVLAVPDDHTDVYLLHQVVWARIDASQALRTRPTILYRRCGSVLRVRVSGCAMQFGNLVRVRLDAGATYRLQSSVALWRQVPRFTSHQHAVGRATELICDAGFEVKRIEGRLRAARGYKAKINSNIELPIFELEAEVVLRDPEAAKLAWIQGIGRGRRFGFGMIDLEHQAS